MANDTLQIMNSMDMALDYEGEMVREGRHVVGIKPNPRSRTVFYAEVLEDGPVAFSIRTGGDLVAHGILPGLDYDGYDYFAGLLIDIDSGMFNQRKGTKL